MGPGMNSHPVAFCKHSSDQCLIAPDPASDEEENGLCTPGGKNVENLLRPARFRPIVEGQINPAAPAPAFRLQPDAGRNGGAGPDKECRHSQHNDYEHYPEHNQSISKSTAGPPGFTSSTTRILPSGLCPMTMHKTTGRMEKKAPNLSI